MKPEILYAIALLTFLVSLVFLPGNHFARRFLENGPVEMLQLAHFVTASLVLLCALFYAFRDKISDRFGLLFIFLGLVWCTHRETDGIWQATDPSLAFEVIRAVLSGILAVLALTRFQSCWTTFRRYLRWGLVRNFAWGVAGYAIVQILSPVIRNATGSRFYKRAVEESFELFFSALFMFGALRVLAHVRNQARLRQDKSIHVEKSSEFDSTWQPALHTEMEADRHSAHTN